MKVSMRWLQEFIDLPTTDPVELEPIMSRLGLEVEGWEVVEARFSDVVIGEVTAIRPHPEADRVRLATVDLGDRTQEVVCGAWNFDVGARVPVAMVGAVLPGDFHITAREIRGVTSEGMICSARELDLGEDADGIMVLDGEAPVGESFADYLPLPDVVFDLSITPNRPDWMSVRGVARELGAFWGLEVRDVDTSLDETNPPTNATVEILAPDLCPRFTAREVRGVRVGPSPLWMQLRLRMADVRPISNVVDITNYVMLELGQPLHAFDLDRITDEKIIVRRAEPGEKMRTLDDVERTLDANDLVVAGVDEVLALAGVMGGGDSEVSENTERVLIEVAHFSAPDTLLTGKRHKLRTEAVARFERGVDPELPPVASARAAKLMADLAGGQVASGFVDAHPRPHQAPTVDLPTNEVSRLLGVDIPREDVDRILEGLGFSVGDAGYTVPSWRPDVDRSADLVEEVARLYGYDEIPARLPVGPGGGLTRTQRRLRRLRDVMAGAGFHEIISFPFVAPETLRRLGYVSDHPLGQPVEVRNPLREDDFALRTTLVPSLLDAVRVNQSRGNRGVQVFEISAVFLPSDDDVPSQPRRLGWAASGTRGVGWQSQGGIEVWDALGTWETVADAMGIDGWEATPTTDPAFHPGRAADITVSGRLLGTVGEVRPSVASEFGVDGTATIGHFDAEVLLEGMDRAPFRPPSQYPPVRIDVAFEVNADVTHADLSASIAAAAGAVLEEVEVFDVFEGSPLPDGKKSLAFHLVLRDDDRTLTDDDANATRDAIATAVADAHGAVLRGGS